MSELYFFSLYLLGEPHKKNTNAGPARICLGPCRIYCVTEQAIHYLDLHRSSRSSIM